MTRKDVLDSALKCVNGDRDRSYGNPEDSFFTIAMFWNYYIFAKSGENVSLNSKDVAAMLALLKIARISGGVYKADNWIDLAGYAACGGEVESTDEEPKKQTFCGYPFEPSIHVTIPDHQID